MLRQRVAASAAAAAAKSRTRADAYSAAAVSADVQSSSSSSEQSEKPAAPAGDVQDGSAPRESLRTTLCATGHYGVSRPPPSA